MTQNISNGHNKVCSILHSNIINFLSSIKEVNLREIQKQNRCNFFVLFYCKKIISQILVFKWNPDSLLVLIKDRSGYVKYNNPIS